MPRLFFPITVFVQDFKTAFRKRGQPSISRIALQVKRMVELLRFAITILNIDGLRNIAVSCFFIIERIPGLPNLFVRINLLFGIKGLVVSKVL